ncbi:MAG: ATP-binding protein [Rhodospirillaceae bacterium]|nr:ATP-binding protein [Rhodospirillaceae bacterium]
MRLPSPRLYWRMALYIGTAIALFLILGAASLVLVASQELANYTAARQGTLAEDAASALAGGGRPALERWLSEEADIPSDVTVFVLDRDSRDILGREVPAAYADFIARFAVGQGERHVPNLQPLRLAPQLIAPDGAVYAFVVMPSRFQVWGSPAVALGIAVAAAVVIATVAWLIARAFGRPIGELQRAARELSLSHFGARVPAAITNRHDELGALAADFNVMAEQIAALVASRQRLMRELSHELRSPLARMQAAVALAAQRGALDGADRARLEQEVVRMDRIIGDLLRFSRLDAAPDMTRSLLRVDDLLAELAGDEEVEAASKGCTVIVRAPRGLTAVGDRELLRSGFENIVRNAIRYSPPGAAVEVEAVAGPGGIEVAVMDRGPGVPAADLHRIFEPFVRVSGATNDGAGTGLGLAIAKRVFEAHGGGISAAARDGGGLIVRVTLPAVELT